MYFFFLVKWIAIFYKFMKISQPKFERPLFQFELPFSEQFQAN